MEIVSGTLYTTDNGSDHLGDDDPDDLLLKVEEGQNYAWPYCYEKNREKLLDTLRNWVRDIPDCGTIPMSLASFKPHSAPLGLTYFDQLKSSPSLLHDSFLVALQGSWDPQIGNGYELVRVSMSGEVDTFMDGFIKTNSERVGRSVHIMRWSDSGFFVTDDFNGRMYYVFESEY